MAIILDNLLGNNLTRGEAIFLARDKGYNKILDGGWETIVFPNGKEERLDVDTRTGKIIPGTRENYLAAIVEIKKNNYSVYTCTDDNKGGVPGP